MRTERPPAGQLLQDGRAGGTIMAGGVCAQKVPVLFLWAFLGKPTKEADILQVLQNIMSGTGIFCQGEGMQKYTILGIKLYDYGAREALRNTDSFLHNGALNTIAYISSSNLAQASKDEQLRECLEAVDMTICTEPDVLEAAGIAGRNRIREIDEKVYLRELLKKFGRNRNSVYLLADTHDNLEVLGEIISEYQDNLLIRGCGAYEDFGNQPERLVNALNDLAPDVVISRMPWPEDLYLMHDYGHFVNAELWVSLPFGAVTWVQNPSLFARLKRKLVYRAFAHNVNEYNKKRDG